MLAIQVVNAEINSTNYRSSIVINSGGNTVNSSGYSLVAQIGDIIGININSSNYIASVGLLAIPDRTYPVVTLISPDNLYTSPSSTVTFIYNVTDINIRACSLYFGLIRVMSENMSSSGTHQFVYATNITLGIDVWYISCRDLSGNDGNSSIRTININVPGSSSSISQGQYYPSFHFVTLNKFGTSYIHRTSDLPLPEEKVEFSVTLSNVREDDEVIYHYSFDKLEWTNISMENKLVNFYAAIGGYPPRTLIYYYVTARRDTRMIRTPFTGYDAIVWDNPPLTEEEEIMQTGKTNLLWIWILAAFIILIIVLIANQVKIMNYIRQNAKK